MTTLAEIRSKLLESQNRTTGTYDNGIYPHWNMPEGKEAIIRFLPDGNSNNTFFWVERNMIKLPFNGIKDSPEKNKVFVPVPCVEMYNEGLTCPILSEVRGWFKDKSLEELGRAYWKKRTYLFQGFVVDDPLNEEDPPENPIRRFIISPQIFQIIKSALMDPELDELPTDYNRGIDFRISKSSKGAYADYTTSKWSRRERPLSKDEQNAIDTFGLFDLVNFLPKKPGQQELAIIKEMFEASVEGQEYDPDRWANYYRPPGISAESAETNDAAATNTNSNVDNVNTTVNNNIGDVDDNLIETKPTDSSDRAKDILNMIRSRQQAS